MDQMGVTGRGRQRHAGQLERDGGRRPAPADVVVEVAEERLEPRIDVGGDTDQQQVHVDLVEPERGREVAQPEDSAGLLRIVGRQLKCLQAGRGLRPVDVLPRRRQQPVHSLVAEVEAPERVVRRRVRGPAGGDQQPDPVLDHAQPTEDVGKAAGRHDDFRRRLPRCGGRHRLGTLLRWRHVPLPPDVAAAVDEVGGVDGEALLDGRPGRVLPTGPHRGEHHQVQRRLQLAAERRPDVREGPVLRRRQADGDLDLLARLGQLADHEVAGQGVVHQERAQQVVEQPVLVLGPLGPRGHQVGQLEEARRGPPQHHRAAVGVALLEVARRAPARVLADVVEVEVHRWRVAAGRPVLRGCVEDDLEVGSAQRLTGHDLVQRVIDLGDHGSAPPHPAGSRAPPTLPTEGPRQQQFPDNRKGTLGLPIGHVVKPQIRPWRSAYATACERLRSCSRVVTSWRTFLTVRSE